MIQKRLLVGTVTSLLLTVAPAFFWALLASPRFSDATVNALVWKCFLGVAYPPVYLSDRIGWYDAFRGDVLEGVSVFDPPTLGTMLWTHSVVAFPFWLVMVLALAQVLQWVVDALRWARSRARGPSGAVL